MDAGRELDTLIAEKVMGWIVDWGKRGPGDYITTDPKNEDDEWRNLPYYSTDIAAAWQVVTETEMFKVDRRILGQPGTCTWYMVEDAYSWVIYEKEGREEPADKEIAQGASAPHAICLAALRAVGVKV